MEKTTALAMTALVEFGYTQEEDNSLVKYKGNRPREKWEPTETGFLRFSRDDGKWAPVPYTINEKWAKVSGLTPDEHPGCYDYVYPADYVLNVYATAVTG